MVNNRASSHSEPKYPYTKLPGALRKILQAIPNRPKPAKLDQKLVVSWGAAKGQSANLRSAVGVLKKVGIIGTNGEPSSLYTQFMDRITGPTALGAKLREVYGDLFNASHSPQTATDEELRSLFNVHAGGSDELVRMQMQTFKALCEFATFGGTPMGMSGGTPNGPSAGSNGAGTGVDGRLIPPVQIDLHIHLPENKTTRDYEAIIQDIAKYIYGRGDQIGG